MRVTLAVKMFSTVSKINPSRNLEVWYKNLFHNALYIPRRFIIILHTLFYQRQELGHWRLKSPSLLFTKTIKLLVM